MSERKVVVEMSGKHCHVTEGTLEKLFGAGFKMEIRKMLSQPGQFATPHKVTVVGPKGQTQLTIIGPCRKYDQIELSLTDARALGFDPPIRESGDVKGSPGCTLIGPEGEVAIPEGVIVAKRHVHLTPEDAAKFGIKDKQIIKVRMDGERGLIFDNVIARVSEEYATFMHIDYDEGNAVSPQPTDSDPIGIILD